MVIEKRLLQNRTTIHFWYTFINSWEKRKSVPIERAKVAHQFWAEKVGSPIRADLRSLPPLMVHVGSGEVLLDDARELEKKAREFGVEVDLQIWPDMVHAWHFFAPILPEGRLAIEVIGEFVKKRTSLNPDR